MVIALLFKISNSFSRFGEGIMAPVLGRKGCARARLFAGLGIAIFIGFSLGCMNLSFGGRTEVVTKESDSIADGVQRGKAYADYGQEVVIYYPIPYASPPNLEIENDGKRYLHIVEQKPDCFKVKNNHVGVEIAWKARGVLVANVNAKSSTGGGTVQASFGTPQTP
jgi:hypothetical protein